MIEGRPSHRKLKAIRAPEGYWKGLRRLYLILMAALWAAQRLVPGRLKRSALRALGRHIGALEHGLRCLLLLMRAAPAPSAKFPEGGLRGRDSSCARAPRRKARRFSLSLSQLAKGFARNGQDCSALTAPRKAHTARHAPPPRGPTASAPIADPAEALMARLHALRAVFADPHAHAAKMTALLRGKGFALRALKAIIPAALIWHLTRHRASAPGKALPCPVPNTS